jgi:hypothetical protein
MAKKSASKTRARKTETVRTAVFYGNMDWFDVEVEDSAPALPKAFRDARKLSLEHATRNAGRVNALLQPYAHACFMPTSLAGWEKHFADQSGDGWFEIEAAWVRLCGVDFKNAPDGPFPLAKMEAAFVVPVTKAFDPKVFDRWVGKNNVTLSDAVSFMWRIPPQKARDEEQLFTWTNNAGVECVRAEARIAIVPEDLIVPEASKGGR